MQVNIGSLPVWRGVQASPGFSVLPFTLGCREGLVRLELEPRHIQELLDGYGREGYSFLTTPPGMSSWGDQRGDLVAGVLAGWVGDLKGAEVIEIGAGTLYLAGKIMDQMGAARYLACDPALRADTVPPGVEVLKDYFSPDKVGGGAFDLAVCPACLEHVADPLEFLRGVAQVLAPRRGRIYIMVPECRASLARGDVGICLHEHLTYFTLGSLRGLLARAGLVLQQWLVTSEAIHALAQAGGRPVADQAWRDEAPWLLERFAAGYRANLERAQTLLRRQAVLGPVALHGCSVALNNILALLEVGDHPALRLYDGDPFKTGKYLPAFGRPIESSSAASYKTMRSVIVGAPLFHRAIAGWVAREHGFQPQDIHCIMPVEAEAGSAAEDIHGRG